MSDQRKYPRSFHVVVKPIGSRCNLDCAYCYYRYKKTDGNRISGDLLEKFIRQYISGQEDDPVVFNWHGGEPALAGLDFFRKVVELERKYAEGHRIRNDFQTNGVLLDESWCEFFKEHDFYVGLSLDGPKHLHDHFRTGFDQAYKAAQLLRRYEVPFNALTVVNRVTAKHPAEVYHFLTEDVGCQRLQWLPCVGREDFQTIAPALEPGPDACHRHVRGQAGQRAGDGLVGRSRRLGRFSLPDVRTVGHNRPGKGSCQLVRVPRGPVDGQAGPDLHAGSRLRAFAGDDGEGRQPVFLRPFRLSRVPAGAFG